MRAPGGGVLSLEQQAAADVGLKTMMPIRDGHVFLDFVLSGLADAGYADVCLVVGGAPVFEALRARYQQTPPTRLTLSIVTQDRPRGTADALLNASAFVGRDDFVVMNADNYYPTDVLATLRRQPAPALPAFDREELVRLGHIPPDRVARYALLELDGRGMLKRVIEKPDDRTFGEMPNAPVSMNCWLFNTQMLDACRMAPPSPRGEFELPFAVQYAIDYFGARFTTFAARGAVLDMSSRGDIAHVCKRLEAVEVSP